MRKNKWYVQAACEEFFTNFKDAMMYAKKISTLSDEMVLIRQVSDGKWYFLYQNGKKVIDNWNV